MTTIWNPELAMTSEHSARVVTCLAEILPGELGTHLGMGFYGVSYMTIEDDTVTTWYFDSTWGGDDTREDGRLRIYVNVVNESGNGYLMMHDASPDDAPFVTDDALTIAKWIVEQIDNGIPPENP